MNTKSSCADRLMHTNPIVQCIHYENVLTQEIYSRQRCAFDKHHYSVQTYTRKSNHNSDKRYFIKSIYTGLTAIKCAGPTVSYDIILIPVHLTCRFMDNNLKSKVNIMKYTFNIWHHVMTYAQSFSNWKNDSI